MKRLFKFKYPKLFFLILAIILAYLIFNNLNMDLLLNDFDKLKYLGMFFGGIIFALGFTMPFAIGFFLTVHPQNLFLAAILAGFGVMLCNLAIFSFLRFSFMDDYKRLEKTKTIQFFEALMRKEFSHKIRVYLLYTFAGLIFVSPIPDEIADVMLAGLPSIKRPIFSLMTFLLSSIGIYILLSV